MNYLAVLAAAIAAFIVGWLWYGPVFGKQWRRLMGMPEGGMGMSGKMSMTQAMVGGFLALLVVCYVLAALMQAVGAFTTSDALALAFWLWLGFIAPVMVGVVLWEGRPFKLYVLNALHWLAALFVAAFVLAWWPW